jgi:hypothetical protein
LFEFVRLHSCPVGAWYTNPSSDPTTSRCVVRAFFMSNTSFRR